MAKAIELIQIDKHYRDNWLRKKQTLFDVCLSVEEGEAFGFVGANGAGKSTTIKIMMGLLKPTKGQAFLYGKPAVDPQARIGVGYVPENPLLYDLLTPMDILQAVVRFHQRRSSGSRQHCMKVLESLSLAHVANKPLRGFSKGMVQRTALAQALVIEPRLLILDEPLSGLDPVGRKEIVDILGAYCANGGTVFFSSHVLHDVERLADRFGLIHQGKMQALCSVAEMAARSTGFSVISCGESAVAELALTPLKKGLWKMSVDGARLWDVLQRLRDAGHSLAEVRPESNLEKMVLELNSPENSHARL